MTEKLQTKLNPTYTKRSYRMNMLYAYILYIISLNVHDLFVYKFVKYFCLDFPRL